jgi:hypothetical protein
MTENAAFWLSLAAVVIGAADLILLGWLLWRHSDQIEAIQGQADADRDLNALNHDSVCRWLARVESGRRDGRGSRLMPLETEAPVGHG